MLPILRTRNGLPGLMNDFFDHDVLSDFFRKDCRLPDVNILENNDNFKIEVAAPGLTKEDFNINLENNVITISSTKEHKEEESKDNFLRKEFLYNSFSRSFGLPNTVNYEKIKASYDNGVLNIFIPKREEAKVKAPKTIKIS